MRWQQLVDETRYSGLYATGPEAEKALRSVLSVLAGQIGGEVRRELIRELPAEAAALLGAGAPAARPLSADGFVAAVAARTTPPSTTQARWAACTVLALLARHIGEDLTRRVLAALPLGYALLFGRSDRLPQAA
ncbi:DUF2267 domain-containing protein [uncultured Streptomyces sp.]|uniref:DUF2267 domain-containing protein n=1 Tax=uncultured Streptomyces sp. TaxID=174707 RepID=UPI002616DAE7|nr:DUF2267 domain-containing protein [uncultured Streptomyces sp.]